MRILVTGAGGFVGQHVVREFETAGHEVVAFDLAHPKPPAKGAVTGDLRDAAAIAALVADRKPDACLHLGGVAFVPMGWSDPHLVFETNLIGTVHILEAFRAHAPSARVLVVTSAEVYGSTPYREPLREDAPMTPSNLYATSKMAADLSALLYARRYSMPVMTARPNNHIGPGQSTRFVTSAFADQLVRIELKAAEPVLRVGNLDSERDFVDVRDVVRGYRMLIEGGRAGEAYNLGSGNYHQIRFILDRLCVLSGLRPRIEVDPLLFRPTISPPPINSEKIRDHVGWKPEIPLSVTLSDILNDTRRRHAARG